MEAFRSYSSSEKYPASKIRMLFLWIVVSCLITAQTGSCSPNARQERQRIETIFRTITVATTTVEFESTPSLCVSLVNATRPCVGRQALWPLLAEEATKNGILPTVLQKVETTMAPAMARLNDRDLELTSNQQVHSSLIEPASLEEKGRAAQRQAPGFIRRITHGFSNALGLARTLVKSVTETRTMTTTYTETVGYNHFYVGDCIPPVLHYPICKNYYELDL